jgi:hypothetical protein
VSDLLCSCAFGRWLILSDNQMLPPEIEKVLQQVQAHANYMPDWQMEVCLFDRYPYAVSGH